MPGCSHAQDNKGNKDFGKACLAEVQRYEQLSAKDFRLNHRLSKLCRNDVAALCKDVCKVKEGDVCGGKVRHCLLGGSCSWCVWLYWQVVGGAVVE